MNWKIVIGAISAIAALLGAIAAFYPKATPTQHIVGDKNFQVSGNQNSIIVGDKPTPVAIPKFSGPVKDEDETSKESIRYARAFNKFIFDNDGKIVQLDVFGYYTQKEWSDPGRYGIKLDHGGFPDPREFSNRDDCESTPMCTGVTYLIDADLKDLDYNPANTARYIRGFFRVKIAGMGQGSWTVRLKHVSDEHMDLLKK